MISFYLKVLSSLVRRRSPLFGLTGRFTSSFLSSPLVSSSESYPSGEYHSSEIFSSIRRFCRMQQIITRRVVLLVSSFPPIRIRIFLRNWNLFHAGIDNFGVAKFLVCWNFTMCWFLEARNHVWRGLECIIVNEDTLWE
jgi:hypothetical protein